MLPWAGSPQGGRPFTAVRPLPQARPMQVGPPLRRPRPTWHVQAQPGWAGHPFWRSSLPQVVAPRRQPLHIMNLRINNVEVPNSKRIEISLQYIFGIGQTTAQTILRDTVRAEGRAGVPRRCARTSRGQQRLVPNHRAWRTRRPMS
jgi:hypothetical protein